MAPLPFPGPPLGRLRVASPADIFRIGIVAASGFRYSPVFDWERPYHAKFPEDTLLSYRLEFSSAIKSQDRIILVATDKFDPNEGEKSSAIIPGNNGWEAPKAGDEVVVGVACWRLEPDSELKGRFQNDDAPYPELPTNPMRDMEKAHCDKLGEHLEKAEDHLRNLSEMEMIVVHPAYWGRGHGTLLTRWGMDFAKSEKVSQGVIAAKMGKKLYNSLGYASLFDIHIDGDDIVPQGVELAVMQYSPSKEPLTL